MGSRDMLDRESFMSRDTMGSNMMSQRSMSMSNGSYGGMNGMGGQPDQPFSRSMSYTGNMAGSSSPPDPAGDGMKIGTWNEGRENGANTATSPASLILKL